MKYIVMKIDDKEKILIFPRCVDHDRMMEACNAVRFGSDRDWERKMFQQEPIAAGFITDGVCHGHSETLGIKSRGKQDTALLKEAFQ